MALLSLNNIEVVYDRVFLAVKGVSIEVPAAGLVALLGANGAGKSTILKAISGLLTPERGEVTRGEITFDGADVLALNAPDRVRRGVVHVLEGRRVFGHLTPAENLLAATSMHRDRTRVGVLMEHMFTLFPRLADRAGAKAGYLSGGEQQMLAIARALMTEPRLILLDEPSLGLAPFLVDEIFDIVRKINAETKVAVLLVEQNAAAALEIAHSAYLVENGRIVMNGTAEVALLSDVFFAIPCERGSIGHRKQIAFHCKQRFRSRLQLRPINPAGYFGIELIGLLAKLFQKTACLLCNKDTLYTAVDRICLSNDEARRLKTINQCSHTNLTRTVQMYIVHYTRYIIKEQFAQKVCCSAVRLCVCCPTGATVQGEADDFGQFRRVLCG